MAPQLAYFCTGTRRWSRRSQWWCCQDRRCSSSAGSQAGRCPRRSGCSGGRSCCSSAQGSTGLGGGQRAKGLHQSLAQPHWVPPIPGDWLAPTLGVAVLEGEGSLVACGQAPTAGEAERPPHLRLVGPPGTQLAGLEAIGRVLARGTLTCGHKNPSILPCHMPRAPLPHALAPLPTQPWQHQYIQSKCCPS